MQLQRLFEDCAASGVRAASHDRFLFVVCLADEAFGRNNPMMLDSRSKKEKRCAPSAEVSSEACPIRVRVGQKVNSWLGRSKFHHQSVATAQVSVSAKGERGNNKECDLLSENNKNTHSAVTRDRFASLTFLCSHLVTLEYLRNHTRVNAIAILPLRASHLHNLAAPLSLSLPSPYTNSPLLRRKRDPRRFEKKKNENVGESQRGKQSHSSWRELERSGSALALEIQGWHEHLT